MASIITRNKNIELGALIVLNESLPIKYPVDFISTTQHSTELDVEMEDNTHDAAVGTLMDAYAAITCTSSALAITLNMGTVIVNDITNVTADPTNKKFILIAILLDDTTGDAEAAAFEKTTGEYGDVPAGKTLGTNVKEYCVEANGTTLVEVNNFI
jgi:hypothetical protein